MVASIRPVLSDDLLERCAQRAAGYDRENSFFFDDFDELREAKYLLAAVPQEELQASSVQPWPQRPWLPFLLWRWLPLCRLGLNIGKYEQSLGI